MKRRSWYRNSDNASKSAFASFFGEGTSRKDGRLSCLMSHGDERGPLKKSISGIYHMMM
jgi:hypothetical protein